MSSKEECEALAKYAQALFSDTEPFQLPELLPLPENWFYPEQWVASLRTLKSHKAVPKHAASIECWKQEAENLAPTLYQIAVNTLCASKPYVPEIWVRVQIAWLPKPGKAPVSPSALRTIGLMGADTKAMLIILKQQANPWIQSALAACPQYAYRQLTSTNDPLLRASLHCSRVRQSLAGYVDDRTAKILKQSTQELLGGIMLGLDLSKAFDSLTYGEILTSLRDTGMPEELCRVLLHVHAKTTLIIEHGGQSRGDQDAEGSKTRLQHCSNDLRVLDNSVMQGHRCATSAPGQGHMDPGSHVHFR